MLNYPAKKSKKKKVSQKKDEAKNTAGTFGVVEEPNSMFHDDMAVDTLNAGQEERKQDAQSERIEPDTDAKVGGADGRDSPQSVNIKVASSSQFGAQEEVAQQNPDLDVSAE